MHSEASGTAREKMWRWRNVICATSDPDRDILEIDAYEEQLRDVRPIFQRIRTLISRLDPLSHYKAFENTDFLLRAIGDVDYPGSPAVDVLW